MRRLILASGSPRRREILKGAGLSFEVVKSRYAEDISLSLSPHELAKALSLGKAGEVAKRRKDALVIAADTFIVLDGEVMGKPRTPDEARRMLAALSGRAHSVVTGIALIDSGSWRAVSRAVETRVWMRPFSAGEIEEYVGTGEPLDKAGAYAIQGLGGALVERVEGDYLNVVGLPLAELMDCLREFGWA